MSTESFSMQNILFASNKVRKLSESDNSRGVKIAKIANCQLSTIIFAIMASISSSN